MIKSNMEVNMKRTLILATATLCCLSGVAARAQTATNLNCSLCVSEPEIAAQSVTSAKIANGTIAGVDIRASTITSDKITNGTLTKADLAAALQNDIDGAIADISFARIAATGGGVVAAQCPSGSVGVAASCECTNGGGARNFGVLFGCTITAGGAAAGCFEEALSFDPQLPAPLANVRAICMAAESVDGTPWTNTAQGLAVDSVSPEAAAARDAELARWMKEQQAEFDAVLARYKAQRAAFEARVSAR
jgi:hypothetical protein